MLPRRWRGPCCHLHWYYQKLLHQSHHHMAHLLTPSKAWHHQVQLFHHHHLPPHYILGADPAVKENKVIYGVTLQLKLILRPSFTVNILFWGGCGNSPVYLEQPHSQCSHFFSGKRSLTDVQQWLPSLYFPWHSDIQITPTSQVYWRRLRCNKVTNNSGCTQNPLL